MEFLATVPWSMKVQLLNLMTDDHNTYIRTIGRVWAPVAARIQPDRTEQRGETRRLMTEHERPGVERGGGTRV